METKDRILQKAFAMLLLKGYDGVSVSDIQWATGMSRGLLYHYFENQHFLLLRAAEQFFDDCCCWDKEQLKDLSVSELITYVVEFYERMGQKLSAYKAGRVTFMRLHLLFFETMRHHPDFAERYREMYESHFTIWKTALLNSFSRGELRTGLNLESLAHHFVYIVDGILCKASAFQGLTDTTYMLNKQLYEFFEIIRR